LWPEHERLRYALDASDDDVENANNALWGLDDQLMAFPAAGIVDLAVKARVTRERLVVSDDMCVLKDYVEQLLADIETLAAQADISYAQSSLPT
jgi:hypothetical protein